MIKEKVSFLVNSQLPEYIRENYPTFIAFLEAYYRFMEQDDEAQAIIQNAKNTRDIDLTVDKFVEKLFAEVASDMPKLIFNNVDPFTDVPLFQNVDEINSKRALAKRMTSFYQTKGGENSIKLLFKVFYDDEIKIDYPQKYMLRASDGFFQKKKTLKVYDPTGNINIESFVGRNVIGLTSNAFAVIDRVTGAGFEYPNINVFELWIEENSMRDTFSAGEQLFCPGANLYVNLLPVISTFTIDDPGFGYVGGESVTVTGSGASFQGKVGYVGDGGRIKSIQIQNFGANYTTVGSASVPMASNTLQGKYEYTDGQLLTAYFSVPHGLKANDIANITLSENTSITDNYIVREVPSATKFRVGFKNKKYVTWNQRGGNLTPSGESTWSSDYFGTAVALSRDGSRLAVLSPGYDTGVTNKGAAYVYERAGNSWLQSNIILTSDSENYDFFNGSIAISGDGTVIILSAPAWESATGNVNVGAVYTYDLANAQTNLWIQRGNILNLTANLPGDYFGQTISVSDNGNTLVVGIPYAEYTGNLTGNVGGVYTFDRSGNDWIQRGSILYDPKYKDEQLFGWSVAISGDANTMVVGTYKSEISSSGNLYTFGTQGNSWIEIASVLSGSSLGSRSHFAEKIALSKNGKVLLATSNTTINGKLYANILSYDFDPELSYWEKRDYELSLLDENPANFYASFPRAIKSLALANETKILAVGEPTANVTGNTNGGKVTVYDSTFQASVGNITVHPRQANLYPIKGTVCNYKGEWLGQSGFISSNIYLQDNDYYQNNSYVIKTGISSVYWRDLLKKIINPVGMKFFAEVFLSLGDENLLAVDATPGKPASFIALLLQLIEEAKVFNAVIPHENVILNINPRSPIDTKSPTYRTIENFKFQYQDLLISELANLIIEDIPNNYDKTFYYQPPMDVYKTGSNLVTNSSFSTSTDWTLNSGWTITSGNAQAVATTSNLDQTVSLENNAAYALSYDIVNISLGTVQTLLKTDGYLQSGPVRSTPGKYTDYFFVYTTNGITVGNVLIKGVASFTGNVDNVTLRKFELVTNT